MCQAKGGMGVIGTHHSLTCHPPSGLCACWIHKFKDPLAVLSFATEILYSAALSRVDVMWTSVPKLQTSQIACTAYSQFCGSNIGMLWLCVHGPGWTQLAYRDGSALCTLRQSLPQATDIGRRPGLQLMMLPSLLSAPLPAFFFLLSFCLSVFLVFLSFLKKSWHQPACLLLVSLCLRQSTTATFLSFCISACLGSEWTRQNVLIVLSCCPHTGKCQPRDRSWPCLWDQSGRTENCHEFHLAHRGN